MDPEPSEDDGAVVEGVAGSAAEPPVDRNPDDGSTVMGTAGSTAEPPLVPSSSDPPVPAPSAPLAVARAGDTLFVVSASGEVLAELPAFADFESLQPQAHVDVQARGEHVLIARSQCRDNGPLDPVAGQSEPPVGSCRLYTMLLRRDGFELAWQRKSALLAYDAIARLGEAGAVSIAASDFETNAWRTLVIDREGDEHAFAGVWAQSAPDAEGFVAVLVQSDSATGEFGFVGLTTSAVQPLSVPMLPWGPAAQDGAILRGPQVDDGAAFTYLGMGDQGAPLLVHERPGEVARIELEAPQDAELELHPAAGSWLLVAYDRDTLARRPWRSVSRESHEVHAPSLPEGFVASKISPTEGDWFRVSDDAGAHGWLDAASGRWKQPPAQPSGQRPFGTEYCESHDFVTKDGRVVVHLRDDVVGRAYLEAEDGVLQPLSAPIVDAVYVESTRIGGTFEIRPVPRDFTYCPEPVWPETPPEGELLRGGQAQYVRGARSLVLEAFPSRAWLSPDGRFVAALPLDGPPVLHDLERDQPVTLSGMDAFEGWL